MVELEKALGQFRLYRLALRKKEPERELFLAIPQEVYNELFVNPDGLELIESESLKIVVFDIDKEEIVEWAS